MAVPIDLAPIADLDLRRHAEDLRLTWQARALASATRCSSNISGYVKARDFTGAVVLSILSHSFDDSMPVLAHLVHGRFEGWTGSILTSIGRVNKAGRVVADLLINGTVYKKAELFQNVDAFKSNLRTFADKLDMTDQERLEFFTSARRWLAADERLDPTFDRNDPDAKRLVH